MYTFSERSQTQKGSAARSSTDTCRDDDEGKLSAWWHHLSGPLPGATDCCFSKQTVGDDGEVEGALEE